MNQRRFYWNELFLFSEKICLFSVSEDAQPAQFCAEYRVWEKPNKYFWRQICKKSDSKNCKLEPTRPACCDCKCKNFPSRKITVRFKLNLKTDGLIYKMIFMFWNRPENQHHCSKQCRRIYICELVGARPFHLLSLKSPTGAFIAALRSANANFALQNTCWEHPNPWTASDGCRLF